MKRVFVINCGSSSLKFALFTDGELRGSGIFERLGRPDAAGRWDVEGESGEFPTADDHRAAVRQTVALLRERLGDDLPIDIVGHRVVHGGEFFRAATLITDEVVERITQCSDLAPLHNPAHVAGIQTARELLPDVPQVAVFDTAFHQSLPEHAWRYAVPDELYRRHAVRRYGAHGTSHAYVAGRAATLLGHPLEDLQLITAHLGNGCSACAVRGGRSVDTTMGLTPLEGLMMGTRSGDVDPNLQPYLERVAGTSATEFIELINRQSGLLGLSGVSNDMRAVVESAQAGNPQAAVAFDVFCYRLAKGVLAMAAGLERVDALVFTGGIGENSAPARARTVGFLRLLGARIDPVRNAANGRESAGRISSAESRLPVLVVPTSEERAIAEQVGAVV